LPAENVHKLVLLKGLIREDGTVDLLQVYRTLLPPMDEAARLAFGRWKFKPAMRDGQPVSVEILVGIPSETPAGRAAQ
jgi:Gram-negative bacterial TonB protein C-terminal